MSTQNNFTSLVGVKWTRSTLLKALEQNYTYQFREALKNPNLSVKRKNEVINQMLQVFLPVFNAVFEYGVTVKKWMTLKYFCDRCDTLLPTKIIFNLTIRGPDSKTRMGYDKSIDLCPICFKHFNYFMKKQQNKTK